MKKYIVFLSGGLGNQMFQYSFYRFLKAAGYNAFCNWGLLAKNNGHNGYELYRVFGLRDVYISRKEVFWARCLYYGVYSHNSGLIRKIVNLFGWALIMNEEQLDSVHDKNCIVLGYWQNPIRFTPFQHYFFNVSILSCKSIQLENEVKWINSVAVHVRRGDYLTSENRSLYGGICTIEYYRNAIDYIMRIVENPVFYIFSNDIEWAKINLRAPVIHYVEGNSGLDSWQDMYLMSICKHNIIANSTFSWWGAYLNRNTEKIVITPEKLSNNGDSPGLFPYKWHCLPSH